MRARLCSRVSVILDSPTSHFGEVFATFAKNDPSALPKLFALWERTPSATVFVVDARGTSAPQAISGPLLDAKLVGWASPTIVAYVTRADQLVLAAADGDERAVVDVPASPARPSCSGPARR